MQPKYLSSNKFIRLTPMHVCVCFSHTAVNVHLQKKQNAFDKCGICLRSTYYASTHIKISEDFLLFGVVDIFGTDYLRRIYYCRCHCPLASGLLRNRAFQLFLRYSASGEVKTGFCYEAQKQVL
jgi:hypothetical protein